MHEHEVRLACHDAEDYQAMMRGGDPPDLDRYIYPEWDAAGMIEFLLVSPYADEAYARTARDALTWAAAVPSFVGKLERSVLHPVRIKSLT